MLADPWDVGAAVVFRLTPRQLSPPARQATDPRWGVTPDVLCNAVKILFALTLPKHIPGLDDVWGHRQKLLDRGETLWHTPALDDPDIQNPKNPQNPTPVTHQQFIGLRGKKGAGKTTVAGMLDDFREYSFADALKELCMYVFLFTDAQVYDPDEKECGDERWDHTTPREILQTVGTELFRNRLPTLLPRLSVGEGGIWVTNTLMRIENVPRVVISDVRFPDEQRFIHKQGGKVIEIVRPQASSQGPEGGLFTGHISENALSECPADATIVNSGSLDDLRKRVGEVVGGVVGEVVGGVVGGR